MTATLSEEHLARLQILAGVLLPGDDRSPAAADLDDYEQLLVRAATAMGPEIGDVAAAINCLPATLTLATLETYRAGHPDDFERISTLVTGAYFIAPASLAAIGYPTGPRRAASFELAADQLGTGILDPVLERGPLYVSP